jgi:hypothetical protein
MLEAEGIADLQGGPHILQLDVNFLVDVPNEESEQLHDMIQDIRGG